MTLATSKNLTILGILTIVGAVCAAGVQFLQGGLPAVNFEVTLTAISAGVAMILGKGAQSTGGTVDGKGVPVVDPAPPRPPAA